jgi:hypothetical protein
MLAVLQCHRQIYQVTVKTSHFGTYIREIMLLIEDVLNDSRMSLPITAMIIVSVLRKDLHYSRLLLACIISFACCHCNSNYAKRFNSKLNKIDRIS